MYWKTYQLPVTIIRPFNIYSKRINPENLYSGVIAKFIDCIKLNKSPIIEGDGKQTRDFIYINDVIQMVKKIMEKKEAIGKIFNCGYGVGISINQLAKLMINISNKNIKVIHTKSRKGDIKNSFANILKAKKLLNFEPKVDMQKGLSYLFEGEI
ncbi:unnamed protein product [marine sediment metagenome]|uniref:NAD-dependent epimerase/dehydratase domain-containing protein n=1 Tax=marine sediment metagenome TaxID=412755 RepID=X0Z1M7_9ZZZZ